MAVVLAVCAAAPVAAAEQRDALADARRLYNQRNFADAIVASEQARLVPARADSADLIAARAYLERFRESAATDDLTSARDRLRRLDPQRFVARERLELVVGLGEVLYFDEAYGASASLFASALDAPDGLAPESRDRVLDWWASAVDRDAHPRPDIDRQAIYDVVTARMQRELAGHPASATAWYWLAAAARGKGDLQGAWDAAAAGWVRAPLVADKGAALRADLDRLMQRAVIPERAKMLAQTPDALRMQWEQFKDRWKKD
jgi:hypothetical protein